MRNAKSRIFWAKTHRGYRYQLSGTGTRMQWAIGIGTTQIGTGTEWQWITGTGTDQSGTGTDQSGTGTISSSSPVFAYFAPLSPVFIH